MDPGLFGCIGALVWVLHRHASLAAIDVARRSALHGARQRLFGATRMGVAMLGGAVFVVAVASLAGAVLPGLDGPTLYVSGVSLALAVLIGIEAAVYDFRCRVARAAARAAARAKRPRSIRTMMRLGIGPRSEPLR